MRIVLPSCRSPPLRQHSQLQSPPLRVTHGGLAPKYQTQKRRLPNIDCQTASFVNWSGRRGSNPRPSAWEANALPTEPLPRLSPPMRRLVPPPDSCIVVSPGFEPGQAEPKTAVLPLHHETIPIRTQAFASSRVQRYIFFGPSQIFWWFLPVFRI